MYCVKMPKLLTLVGIGSFLSTSVNYQLRVLNTWK